jgi:riboflavin kinase/FMN adenylyltransferase
MIRLDHRDPMPEALRGAIVALGNFDGFHQGHQAVVGAAIDWARAEGRPCIVATFDPHPMRHFKPETEPFRLTTLDQRQELFAAAGADAMLVFHFDGALATMPAENWIEQVIAGHIGAAGVVTGEDFTFGRGRTGSPALLREVGARFGMGARTVGAVHDAEGPVSSSRIREALKSGDCDTATRLLTRPFAIRGVVEHGDKLGRSIGFPTANLTLGTYLRPRYGIYAVTGLLPGGRDGRRRVAGAANVGIRPSFDPPKELLEPYFFDFSGDLYGQEIEVAFHAFLRPEARFDSLEALTAQMNRDCDEARARLASLTL